MGRAPDGKELEQIGTPGPEEGSRRAPKGVWILC